MTTRKLKDKRHPKIINDFMVYEGLNDINSVFGALIAFEVYMKSDKFNSYHGGLALQSIRAALCAGTGIIEEWLEIEEEVKP
jgi:hypothetical protein